VGFVGILRKASSANLLEGVWSPFSVDMLLEVVGPYGYGEAWFHCSLSRSCRRFGAHVATFSGSHSAHSQPLEFEKTHLAIEACWFCHLVSFTASVNWCLSV
jgi:hypothetical protein